MLHGLLLLTLVLALAVCLGWYARGLGRWLRTLKSASNGLTSVEERKAFLASAEYRAARRAARLPLNLAAACTLLLYLLFEWR